MVVTPAAIQEQIPIGYVSPTGWFRLKTGTYADPNMLVGADGKPLTGINIYQGHLALQRLGIRGIDNIEFNDMINSNPEAAEQMRKYAVWTSLLLDVERAPKGNGYTARHIARLFVKTKKGTYKVEGPEKAIKLPNGGYFKISHILSSEDGLPHETFPNEPDEPWAYWEIAENPERHVARGCWNLDGPGQFCACALWVPSGSDPYVGVRGASDEEPKPIDFATAEALSRLDEIGRRYGVETSDIACALTKKVKPSDIVL